MHEKKDNNDVEEFSIGDESIEVGDRNPGVEAAGFKRKLIYVLLVGVGFFFVYKFFSSESKKPEVSVPPVESRLEERVVESRKVVSKEGVAVPKDDVVPILLPPKLPELPKLPAIPVPSRSEVVAAPNKSVAGPSLPSFLPPPPSGPSPMDPPNKVSGGNYRYNKSAPMIAFGGGGISSSSDNSSGVSISDPASLLDPSKVGELRKSLQQRDTTAPEDKFPERSANQVVAGYVGDLNYILTEGKMLDAVLETAVNTGLNAKVRAIISRDVFSESGRQVLIPRGSRLIGSYSTDISFTQSRVDIIWTRIILPNGVDVSLGDFKAVDPLGRAGVRGIVNNKVSNVMSTSIILATARVASGMIVDKIMGSDKSQVNFPPRRKVNAKDDNDDDAKIKGSPGAIIGMQAVQDASKQVTEYVKRMADTRPTITVNQGTRLKVFVNQDIVFPKAVFREYKVLD